MDRISLLTDRPFDVRIRPHGQASPDPIADRQRRLPAPRPSTLRS